MTFVISRGTPPTKTPHMIALVVLWSILGVAAAHGQAPVPPPGLAGTVREQLDAGHRALASRRFTEAVAHFSRAVAADTAKGEAYLWLGEAYWADDRQDSLSVDRASRDRPWRVSPVAHHRAAARPASPIRDAD